MKLSIFIFHAAILIFDKGIEKETDLNNDTQYI